MLLRCTMTITIGCITIHITWSFGLWEYFPPKPCWTWSHSIDCTQDNAHTGVFLIWFIDADIDLEMGPEPELIHRHGPEGRSYQSSWWNNT